MDVEDLAQQLAQRNEAASDRIISHIMTLQTSREQSLLYSELIKEVAVILDGRFATKNTWMAVHNTRLWIRIERRSFRKPRMVFCSSNRKGKPSGSLLHALDIQNPNEAGLYFFMQQADNIAASFKAVEKPTMSARTTIEALLRNKN